MRDRRSWNVVMTLLAASVVMYVGLFVLFPSRLVDIEFYTLLDVAFIPISAVLVGLFINRLLAARERQELIHKMNMVVGAFFSEMGRELIDLLLPFDTDVAHDQEHLRFSAAWTPADFADHRRAVAGDHHPMSWDAGDAGALRDALVRRRSFVLGLLQNGNLLEHESFTDMLWAVSHLTEELAARRDLENLPPSDVRHLELDMARAYGRLLGEYLLYVEHLRSDYPYLFSFAMRTNPFVEGARVEVDD